MECGALTPLAAVHEMGAPRITTTIKLGTRTDRVQTMEEKVRSVQEKLRAGQSALFAGSGRKGVSPSGCTGRKTGK